MDKMLLLHRLQILTRWEYLLLLEISFPFKFENIYIGNLIRSDLVNEVRCAKLVTRSKNM